MEPETKPDKTVEAEANAATDTGPVTTTAAETTETAAHDEAVTMTLSPSASVPASMSASASASAPTTVSVTEPPKSAVSPITETDRHTDLETAAPAAPAPAEPSAPSTSTSPSAPAAAPATSLSTPSPTRTPSTLPTPALTIVTSAPSTNPNPNPNPNSSPSRSPSSLHSPGSLSPHPERRSSLDNRRMSPTSPVGGPSQSQSSQSSLLTPAPALTRTATPPAPSKPPPPGSTRVAADLEEFDPLATPAPGAPPKRKERREGREQGGLGQGRKGEAGPSRPQPPAGGGQLAHPQDPPSRQATPSRRSRDGDEPQFNFSGFLRDLRTKPAEPVARYLKSFLTNFARKPFTVNEQIKLIRDFLAFIGDKMRVVEPWKSQKEPEFDNALEAMEKLVMNRLYPYTFTPQISGSTTITTDDLERDAVFAQRVRLFGWVQEKHLDVPEGDQSAGFLAFAQTELLKISHYKAPRDKMICILNCCKVIFGLIRHTQGTDAGADAFVPILILVVLRANPDNMLSNVEYINRFRNPDKLMGEGGYYLSSLQGAIAFIETMDASSLSNITQEEFESNVEQAIRDLPTSATSPRVESVPTVRGEVSPFATLPGEEPARPLTMPATAAALDGTKRFFQRTGDAAKEAVSRPLTAIGKILDSMQAAAESESGEEDTDEDERMKGEIERAAWQHHQHQLSQSSVHSQSQGNQGQGLSQSQSQNSNPRSPQPQPPSRLLAQLGLSPGPSESTTPTAHTPTPETAQQLYAQRQLLQQYAQQTPGYPQTPYQQSPGYQSTPGYHQSPTPAGAGYQPSPAGYGSPGYPGQYHQQQQQQNATAQAHMQIQLQAQQLAQQQALEASHEAYAREQARVANVTTLTQMFPALGEDVADAVLYSCGDDLGLAIDRMLEM